MRIYIHVDPSGGYSEWTYVCKTPLTHVHEAVTAFVDAYNCKFPTQQLTPSLLVAMANNKPLEPTKKISTLLDDHDSCELALVHVATSPPPQPVVTSVEPRKPNHGAVDMLLGHANKHRQNNAWRSAKALWEAVLVDMDTANASAMQGMVDLYMQSTQWTKAKSVLLKLLLADPTHQAPRLQLATCEMHLANSGRAITILQELLSTPSLTPDMDHDASILLATALYECGSIKDQDKAVSILVHLLDKSNHTDMDAMALYSQVAHDRGKPAQAMQMMLKVLVDRPKDKRVQAKCAAFLEAPRGFEYLQLALDPTSPSTAPAYAYLASVAKDHGAMTACVSCFQQAVAQCPSDVMFALNYVHALEVCGRYGDAFVVVKQFVHNTPTTVVGMDLTCQDIAAVLAPYSTLDDASGHWTEEAAMAWKGTHVCVYHNDAKFERAVATTVDLTGQQLDLLALLCTLVKANTDIWKSATLTYIYIACLDLVPARVPSPRARFGRCNRTVAVPLRPPPAHDVDPQRARVLLVHHAAGDHPVAPCAAAPSVKYHLRVWRLACVGDGMAVRGCPCPGSGARDGPQTLAFAQDIDVLPQSALFQRDQVHSTWGHCRVCVWRNRLPRRASCGRGKVSLRGDP
ncbi:hypothetical protein, variant 3 [Aphanomyces astaci]|uniref:Uncharacterized protein n=1 Tax=Aphanomyces astaci TaxID=112090 RepID=W4HCR4_APHAT|nr:hypothetical protein, variant 3 [Aphanomyces astaci]ETV89381.1 hypothetical protein, variant 3 [Aphanomyces astaci]|eukprot:XP_009821781.1 hypothetical protein, variant 3 [Aphanomyces astaci]